MIYRNFQNLPYLLTKEKKKIEKEKEKETTFTKKQLKAIPRIDMHYIYIYRVQPTPHISGLLATKNTKSLISRAIKVKVISTLA